MSPPDTDLVAGAVAQAHREEWAQVLAATVRLTRDFNLAEECAQEAYVKALQVWRASGVPRRPGAWLTTVARNRARDMMRRESAFRRTLPLLVVDEPAASPDSVGDRSDIDDDRLRLIFTCCHPALEQPAQVALTLRLMCGLSTAEVARAFLVQESTMAARITRAKKKIASARIPYRVPSHADLPGRISAALEVVHLVFTTGHTAPIGERLVRADLLDEGLHLARLMHQLLPEDAEAGGLLALILLTDARRATRTSATGELVLLRDQDRSRWDRRMIGEGRNILLQTLAGYPPNRYTIQAAVAAVHADAPTWQDTDWAEIVALYDVLRTLWPSPVVELNRGIAIGLGEGPQAGLVALAPLLNEPALAAYHYLSAARADFLRQLERWEEAVTSYEEALALTDNEVEHAFLRGRLDEVHGERDQAR